MQDLYYAVWLCVLALFLALPAFVLAVRFARPRQMPWGRLMASVVLGGWVLWLAMIWARSWYLDALVLGADNPDVSDPLVLEWVADGARNMWAVSCGWVSALMYFVPWLCVYGAACTVRIWLPRIHVACLRRAGGSGS